MLYKEYWDGNKFTHKKTDAWLYFNPRVATVALAMETNWADHRDERETIYTIEPCNLHDPHTTNFVIIRLIEIKATNV